MKNLLLGQLSTDDFNRIEPYLKPTVFKQHSVLFQAEAQIQHVHFLSSALSLRSGPETLSRPQWSGPMGLLEHRPHKTDAPRVRHRRAPGRTGP
jgi:hypothetical protein